MKLSAYPSILVALLGFLLVNASPLHGADTTEAKAKKIPFHGKLEAVDTSAQTITIAGKTPRVFKLTTTTIITDGARNPSTLSAAVVGEDVGGSYTKDASGAKELFSVRFGAKAGEKASTTSTTAATPTAAPAPAVTTPSPAPAAETAAAPAAKTPEAKVKKEKFSGKVVSVDAAANTLVVHGKADQTFTLTSTTKITGGTLADAVAGTKVSGTYTKSADGATLTVSTLKITK
jgi:hypothetical protein